MATLADLAGGFKGMGGRKRPTTGGVKSPFAGYDYSGDAANPAGGGYTGPAVAPTGDSTGSGYQPPRLPPIVPGMQGNEGGYTGSPGYATTPQTQAPSLSAPFNPGTATGEQRPPFSADPPPMGEPGGTRMPPIQPPPGGWPMATGYTPPAYDPSTDPLAQGGATGGGNFGGGLLSQPYAYTPTLTPTGPGQSGGADRMRPPTSEDRRGMREALQDPALKSERQARMIEILKNNPNFGSDPRMMQMLRQEDLQRLLASNSGIASNANFNKVNKQRTFTADEIAAYNAAKGLK